MVQPFTGAAPGESPAVAVPGAGFEPYPTPSQYLEPPPDPSPPGAVPGSTEPGAQPPEPTQPSEAERRASAAEAELGQFRAAWGEMQQMFARAEAERVEQERRTQAQTRQDAAYAQAADLDPETAITFLRQFHAGEAAQQQREREELQRQAEARVWQVASHFAGPQYARERAKELALPDEYADLLAGVPAELIDHVLPFAQLIAKQQTNFQGQVEQLGRTAQAEDLAASGVHAPSGNGAIPVRPEVDRFNPASPEYDRKAFLANILQRAGVMRPPNQ